MQLHSTLEPVPDLDLLFPEPKAGPNLKLTNGFEYEWKAVEKAGPNTMTWLFPDGTTEQHYPIESDGSPYALPDDFTFTYQGQEVRAVDASFHGKTLNVAPKTDDRQESSQETSQQTPSASTAAGVQGRPAKRRRSGSSRRLRRRSGSVRTVTKPYEKQQPSKGAQLQNLYEALRDGGLMDWLPTPLQRRWQRVEMRQRLLGMFSGADPTHQVVLNNYLEQDVFEGNFEPFIIKGATLTGAGVRYDCDDPAGNSGKNMYQTETVNNVMRIAPGGNQTVEEARREIVAAAQQNWEGLTLDGRRPPENFDLPEVGINEHGVWQLTYSLPRGLKPLLQALKNVMTRKFRPKVPCFTQPGQEFEVIRFEEEEDNGVRRPKDDGQATIGLPKDGRQGVVAVEVKCQVEKANYEQPQSVFTLSKGWYVVTRAAPLQIRAKPKSGGDEVIFNLSNLLPTSQVGDLQQRQKRRQQKIDALRFRSACMSWIQGSPTQKFPKGKLRFDHVKDGDRALFDGIAFWEAGNGYAHKAPQGGGGDSSSSLPIIQQDVVENLNGDQTGTENVPDQTSSPPLVWTGNSAESEPDQTETELEMMMVPQTPVPNNNRSPLSIRQPDVMPPDGFLSPTPPLYFTGNPAESEPEMKMDEITNTPVNPQTELDLNALGAPQTPVPPPSPTDSKIAALLADLLRIQQRTLGRYERRAMPVPRRPQSGWYHGDVHDPDRTWHPYSFQYHLLEGQSQDAWWKDAEGGMRAWLWEYFPVTRWQQGEPGTRIELPAAARAPADRARARVRAASQAPLSRMTLAKPSKNNQSSNRRSKGTSGAEAKDVMTTLPWLGKEEIYNQDDVSVFKDGQVAWKVMRFNSRPFQNDQWSPDTFVDKIDAKFQAEAQFVKSIGRGREQHQNAPRHVEVREYGVANVSSSQQALYVQMKYRESLDKRKMAQDSMAQLTKAFAKLERDTQKSAWCYLDMRTTNMSYDKDNNEIVLLDLGSFTQGPTNVMTYPPMACLGRAADCPCTNQAFAVQVAKLQALLQMAQEDETKWHAKDGVLKQGTYGFQKSVGFTAADNAELGITIDGQKITFSKPMTVVKASEKLRPTDNFIAFWKEQSRSFYYDFSDAFLYNRDDNEATYIARKALVDQFHKRDDLFPAIVADLRSTSHYKAELKASEARKAAQDAEEAAARTAAEASNQKRKADRDEKTKIKQGKAAKAAEAKRTSIIKRHLDLVGSIQSLGGLKRDYFEKQIKGSWQSAKNGDSQLTFEGLDKAIGALESAIALQQKAQYDSTLRSELDSALGAMTASAKAQAQQADPQLESRDLDAAIAALEQLIDGAEEAESNATQ